MGMLVPEEVEDTLGTAEVRQTFRASRVGTIAGCHVLGLAIASAIAPPCVLASLAFRSPETRDHHWKGHS